VQVGVADPGSGDGYLHLASPRRGKFHVGDPDRLAGPAEDRRPDRAARWPRLARNHAHHAVITPLRAPRYWSPSAISASNS